MADDLSIDPVELDSLLETLTLKVSCFFRNPFVFEVLGKMALPRLLETFGRGTLRS